MFVNINDIVSQPTSMTSASLQYAHVDSNDNIVQVYTTRQSAQYMVSLLGGYVLEVFRVRDKILAIGDVL
jgi:hypothetical protein